MITIKVRNKDRLFAWLRTRVPALQRAVEAANLKSAHEMADMMRRLVPKLSGDLHDSITVTGPGETTPGGRHVPAGAVMITAGAKEIYEAMIEFGTVKTPAQPFFFSSYHANKARAKRRVSTAMRKAIKGG